MYLLSPYEVHILRYIKEKGKKFSHTLRTVVIKPPHIINHVYAHVLRFVKHAQHLVFLPHAYLLMAIGIPAYVSDTWDVVSNDFTVMFVPILT